MKKQQTWRTFFPWVAGVILVIILIFDAYTYLNQDRHYRQQFRLMQIQEYQTAIEHYLRDYPEGSSLWPDAFIIADEAGVRTCNNQRQDFLLYSLRRPLNDYLRTLPRDPESDAEGVSYYYLRRNQVGWELGHCLGQAMDPISINTSQK